MNLNLTAFGARRTRSTIVLGPMAQNGLTLFKDFPFLLENTPSHTCKHVLSGNRISKARQANVMLTPCRATAFMAISRRRDGLSDFFQALSSKDHCMLISAYMRFRRRFFSAISFISEIKDASTLVTSLRDTLPCSACHQTSPAIYRN